jgi:hypothetical protein
MPDNVGAVAKHGGCHTAKNEHRQEHWPVETTPMAATVKNGGDVSRAGMSVDFT